MFLYTMLINMMFFGLPLATLIWFVCSLLRYISARRREKNQPGSVSEFEMRSRKFNLVSSAVVCGILFAIVLGIVIMLTMAIAYM